MRTPEEIKKALKVCADNPGCARHKCPLYKKAPSCFSTLKLEALAYIQQLEERIDLMLVQMQGDCGCCKHKYDERQIPDEQLKCKLSPACYECLKAGGRSQWEYEGLPDLPEKGAAE